MSGAPMVQILDAPVPQTGEQLPDTLSFFGALLPDPEQAIEVPKILLDDVPMRTVVRDTQLEGTVGGSANAALVRLLWFSPRRSVRGERFDVFTVVGVVLVEVFKVLVLDRIQQRLWSRSLTFQLVGVFLIFSRDRVHNNHSNHDNHDNHDNNRRSDSSVTAREARFPS